jgi:hypothetical protein
MDYMHISTKVQFVGIFLKLFQNHRGKLAYGYSGWRAIEIFNGVGDSNDIPKSDCSIYSAILPLPMLKIPLELAS